MIGDTGNRRKRDMVVCTGFRQPVVSPKATEESEHAKACMFSKCRNFTGKHKSGDSPTFSRGFAI